MVSALAVGGAYLAFGPRSTTTQPTPPATALATSPSPSEASTAPKPAESTEPAAPSSPPASDSAPLPSPNPTSTPPDDSPQPPPDPEEEPAETALPAGVVELNDTSFTAADGWVIYGDDLVEGDRRVVRLSDPGSDARLQALTLVQDPDLTASCEALVAAQKGQFAVTSEQLARPVGVPAAEGSGVSCGFAGVRSSDGLANTVSFTLLRRATDSHVLMLRTTIPDSIGVGDQPRRDLTRMSCSASTNFGVGLPLC